VLLVHPGGPYWRNKDDGAWSIPKGEIGTSEDPEQTARREFTEELGPAASIGHLQALGEIRQRGGKRVIAFCGETDFDTSSLSSNTFEIEWPPKSGRLQPFPEIDRAEWFDLEVARTKILSGQIELIDRLKKKESDVTRLHRQRKLWFRVVDTLQRRQRDAQKPDRLGDRHLVLQQGDR
jgi:predicted NUDIX family NTP pyrophosphohydrolase